MDNVQMEFTRNDIFTLFNSLLVREKSIFVKQNKEWEVLLKRLWKETADRSKREVLWNKGFREQLEFWNIAYKEDLIRLDIPEILKDDEES